MKKKFGLALLLLFCLCLLPACSSSDSKGTKTAAKDVYVISEGNLDTFGDGQGTVSVGQNAVYHYAVDGEGKVILPATKDSIGILYDKQTEEPRYLTQYHIDASDQRDEYGFPENVTYMAALYDLDGNLVRDYAECSYGQLIGDTVAYYDGDTVSLLNIKTGETIYENLQSLDIMDSRIFATTADQQYILGDYAGNVIKRIESGQYNYALGYQDYVVVVQDDLHGIMDADGNMRVEAKYSDIQKLWDNYVLCINAESYDVLDIDTGELVFQSPDQVNYYDGTTAIIRKTEKGNDDIGQDEKYQELLKEDPAAAKDYARRYNGKFGEDKLYLADAQGNIFSEAYEMLYACYNEDDNSGQQYFQGRKQRQEKEDAQDTISVLDSTGQVLFNFTGQSVSVDPAGNDRFIVSDFGGKMLDDGTYVNQSKAMFVDKEGKPLIDNKKYQYINTLYNSRGEKEQYYTASYVSSQGLTLYDLLDSNGNVLVSQLKSCYQCDGRRIVGTKGFSSGLMDMKGNWIYETSVFQELED